MCNSKTTYYRSQIIPCNKDTMVYWGESDGKEFDLLEKDVPEGSIVLDVTYQNDVREVRKERGKFVLHFRNSNTH